MKLGNFIIFLLFCFSTVSITKAQITASGCDVDFPINYADSVSFTDIQDLPGYNCPSGQVRFNDLNDFDGTAKLVFDETITLDSIEFNFANGNNPIEIIIPVGVTLTVNRGVLFDVNSNPQDKFFTVNGALDVGGELDFGDIDVEIAGNGTIDADAIDGASGVTCTIEPCPAVTSNTCDDGTGGDPTGPCASTLPIELALFEVEKIDNKVEITWITATEENNDYFTLERSRNGKEYETLTVIQGAGTSFEPLNYSYSDERPMFGQSYYRLSQTDYDGTSETFTPRGIYLSGFSDVIVFPNPVNKGEKLTINHTAQEGEKIEVTLYSPSGVAVLTKSLSANDYYIDLDKELQSGFYMLKIKSGNNQVIQRLLIN